MKKLLKYGIVSLSLSALGFALGETNLPFVGTVLVKAEDMEDSSIKIVTIIKIIANEGAPVPYDIILRPGETYSLLEGNEKLVSGPSSVSYEDVADNAIIELAVEREKDTLVRHVLFSKVKNGVTVSSEYVTLRPGETYEFPYQAGKEMIISGQAIIHYDDIVHLNDYENYFFTVKEGGVRVAIARKEVNDRKSYEIAIELKPGEVYNFDYNPNEEEIVSGSQSIRYEDIVPYENDNLLQPFLVHKFFETRLKDVTGPTVIVTVLARDITDGNSFESRKSLREKLNFTGEGIERTADGYIQFYLHPNESRKIEAPEIPGYVIKNTIFYYHPLDGLAAAGPVEPSQKIGGSKLVVSYSDIADVNLRQRNARLIFQYIRKEETAKPVQKPKTISISYVDQAVLNARNTESITLNPGESWKIKDLTATGLDYVSGPKSLTYEEAVDGQTYEVTVMPKAQTLLVQKVNISYYDITANREFRSDVTYIHPDDIRTITPKDIEGYTYKSREDRSGNVTFYYERLPRLRVLSPGSTVAEGYWAIYYDLATGKELDRDYHPYGEAVDGQNKIKEFPGYKYKHTVSNFSDTINFAYEAINTGGSSNIQPSTPSNPTEGYWVYYYDRTNQKMIDKVYRPLGSNSEEGEAKDILGYAYQHTYLTPGTVLFVYDAVLPESRVLSPGSTIAEGYWAVYRDQTTGKQLALEYHPYGTSYDGRNRVKVFPGYKYKYTVGYFSDFIDFVYEAIETGGEADTKPLTPSDSGNGYWVYYYDRTNQKMMDKVYRPQGSISEEGEAKAISGYAHQHTYQASKTVLFVYDVSEPATPESTEGYWVFYYDRTNKKTIDKVYRPHGFNYQEGRAKDIPGYIYQYSYGNPGYVTFVYDVETSRVPESTDGYWAVHHDLTNKKVLERVYYPTEVASDRKPKDFPGYKYTYHVSHFSNYVDFFYEVIKTEEGANKDSGPVVSLSDPIHFTSPKNSVTVTINPSDAGKIINITTEAVTDATTLGKLPATIKPNNIALYDIKVLDANNQVTQISEPAQVTLSVDPSRRVIKVIYFLPETGATEDIAFQISPDGRSVIFTVLHFSQYGVVYADQLLENSVHSTGSTSINLTSAPSGGQAVSSASGNATSNLSAPHNNEPIMATTASLPKTGEDTRLVTTALGVAMIVSSLGLARRRKAD